MKRSHRIILTVILTLFFLWFWDKVAFAYEEPVAGFALVVDKAIEVQEENGINIMVCALSVDMQIYINDSCDEVEINPDLVTGLLEIESNFDQDATHRNGNGTIDRGMAQINSRYEGYYEEIYDREFDPFNPYDAVDFVILRFLDEVEYWSNRGINGIELTYCILGSYNMGRASYKYDLVDNGRYTYNYIDKVLGAMDSY